MRIRKFTFIQEDMEAKIFVIALPSLKSVAEEIGSLIEDAFDKPKVKKCGTVKKTKPCDFTPSHLKVKDSFGRTPKGAWGVCGKEADENLRFGYQGPCIDEPRKQDFCDWDDFLEAREAFDDFVDAGERCVDLGLEKKSNAPIHKCNAVRKRIGCPPPMNMELIGESQFPWWEKRGLLDWNF